MKPNHTIVAIVMIRIAGSALGAIVIDGTREAEYGAARAVQTIQTGFGDASDPNGLGSGGELDAAYAVIQGGRLYVMITGNIEPNFNKVSIFIDSRSGGENVLSSTPRYDFENISTNFGGLTFDTGFEADYHVYARWGGGAFTVDIVDRSGGAIAVVSGNGAMATNGSGSGIQSGVINPGDSGLGSDGVGEVRNLSPFLSSPMPFAFNNTNTGGVGGISGAAANASAALAVSTGLEFSVALADIGSPGIAQPIHLHVVYGNSNNNFHSNQTLAGLPVGTGNLGGDGNGGFINNLSGVNFNHFSGDQFFTVFVPIPGDFDDDGDVDLDDYAFLADCLAGPNTSPTPTIATSGDCLDAFDFDSDTDVDLSDAGAFQTFFSLP